MIKTLSNIFKQDKEKFVIPKGVQQAIPIQAVWADGIFQIGRNKFARTYKFVDINYAVASREDKEAMFLEYSELLNSFDSGATTKITINNRRLNKQDFEKAILIPMQEDGLDLYRKEYNAMLLEKATGANSIVQEKYVTVSVYKKSIEEARTYFARIGTDLVSHFSRLGSKCVEMDATDMPRTRRSVEPTELSMKPHIRRGSRAAGLQIRQRKSTEPLKKRKKPKQRKQPTRESVAGAVPPTGSLPNLPGLPSRQAGESLTSRKSR